MPHTYTLTLGRNDLLQITLGLEVRATQWAMTAEYLEQGDTDDPEFMPEDCTRPEEARRIAGQYQSILRQLEAQGGWTK
jgi:hypothetical protein